MRHGGIWKNASDGFHVLQVPFNPFIKKTFACGLSFVSVA
jgi:hypothetical protein